MNAKTKRKIGAEQQAREVLVRPLQAVIMCGACVSSYIIYERIMMSRNYFYCKEK